MFCLTTQSTHFILRLYGVREDDCRGEDDYRLLNGKKEGKKEGRKDMFYLTTHSTHFILRLYGVGHMVTDHSDSERGNPLPPYRLLFPISSKGSFICIILQTG